MLSTVVAYSHTFQPWVNMELQQCAKYATLGSSFSPVIKIETATFPDIRQTKQWGTKQKK